MPTFPGFTSSETFTSVPDSFLRDLLAEIRDALLKIDGKLDPPFGACEPCSDEDQKLCATCPWIPSARLDAMPHARMCVQTKELDEKRRG